MSVGYYLAKPDTPMWNEAWEALADEFGDYACKDPITGEKWQYMGTERGRNGPDTWTHCFRHRHLRGERVYRHYPATPPEPPV